jgi:hypothetical protein
MSYPVRHSSRLAGCGESGFSALDEQPEPGIMRWTLPNGRSHTTSPTVYDV